MNIFYIDTDVKKCAEYHCSKHVIKMILEHCQILSTAHRVLDGISEIGLCKSGRKRTQFMLPDERDNILYKSTHCNHPSTIWARKSSENYKFLYQLTLELCKEYNYRYGKIHKCESSGLVACLKELPKNIPIGIFTEPTPAMDDKYIIKDDSIASYRNYYIKAKNHIANWNGTKNSRPVPLWFTLQEIK